jgi:hypothetical protein
MNGSLANTILASNAPGGNCSGSFTDAGHNLSSDAVKLGPLANNGGPTPTMSLSLDSPALDAGDTASAPPTDQRGFPRPVGAKPDIGAYELCYLPVLEMQHISDDGLSVVIRGTNGLTCQLLTSTDFLGWQPFSTNQIVTNEMMVCPGIGSVTEALRFYRAVAP